MAINLYKVLHTFICWIELDWQVSIQAMLITAYGQATSNRRKQWNEVIIQITEDTRMC